MPMGTGAHRDEAEQRQVRYLTSRSVQDRLARILSDHGHRLVEAELVDLQHRPGAGVTGIFRTHCADEDELYLVLTAESVPAEAVIDAGEDADGRWSAWFHPHDPVLTGLPLATDPDTVAALWGGGGHLVDLQTVGYRPLRRAVLRAEIAGEEGTRTLFLKVMRPGLALPLHRRHTLLAAAGVPVPAVVGPPVADVVALEQGWGTVLARAIMADGARSIRPAELIEVLDRMPPELLDLPRKEAWSDRIVDYGHAAATALPDRARRIRSLVEHLGRRLDATDRGPMVPSHGDFYEANLLVSGNHISGVLDVDGAGPGYRVDDLACFLGHLAVLPAVDHRYVFVGIALRRFHSAFLEGVDPAALACRSAAVALSLVAGARDSGRRDWQSSARHRLDIAEQLLDLPLTASGW